MIDVGPAGLKESALSKENQTRNLLPEWQFSNGTCRRQSTVLMVTP
jgi:hypothetical protein